MDVMDCRAFARPPPPGFFGALPHRVLPVTRELFDAGVEACARPVVDVPARRPPRPGFFPLPARRGPVYATDPVAEDGASLKASKEHSVLVSRVAASKNPTTRPRLCSDYDEDLDSNLKAMEKDAEERPLPDYLKTVQRDQMSPSARASLVVWMDTFVRHYDLAPGTLHSAVAYVDRVLSAQALASHSDYELRLLGAAAAFTAAKYEDQRTSQKLNADDIAWYGGFAAGREVLHTERRMVAALGYRLGGPTAYTFVGHFMRYGQGEEDLQVQRLAHRLADQSLLDYACLGFLPSVVAASAIFLARWALKPPDVLPWSMELQELTGYGPLDLSGCVRAMYSFSRSLICDPRC